MRNIILIAPPGGGKGTLSKKLLEEYPFNHISTGDLLREKAKDNKEIREIMEKGLFVSSDTVLSLIKEALLKNKEAFILDGYPRNMEQAEALDDLLERLGRQNFVVLYINTPKDEIVKRITGRRQCTNCGAIYNMNSDEYRPQFEGICDKCSSPLYERVDDNLDTLENRLKTYNEETRPILEHYRDRVVELNGLNLDVKKIMELLND